MEGNSIDSERNCNRRFRSRQQQRRYSIGNFVVTTCSAAAIVFSLLSSAHSCDALMTRSSRFARQVLRRQHAASIKASKQSSPDTTGVPRPQPRQQQRRNNADAATVPVACVDATTNNNEVVSMSEIELSLADGMVLRGQQWSCTGGQVTIGGH